MTEVPPILPPDPGPPDPEPPDPGGAPTGFPVLDLDGELSREFGDFLEECRRLGTETPDDRLQATLRARVLLRCRYRESLAARGVTEHMDLAWHRLKSHLKTSVLSRVILFLLLLSGGLFFGVPAILRLSSGNDGSAPIAGAGLLPKHLPEDGAKLPLRKTGLPRGNTVRSPYLRSWLQAENDLRRLRELFAERGNMDLRERLAKVGGADRRTRYRIDHLAQAVSDDLMHWEDELQDVFQRYAKVEELSLGLRALLATGSTTTMGQHAVAVRHALNQIETIVPSLNGAALATALSGYMEAVLVTGQEDRLALFARELSRFTKAQAYLLEQEEKRKAVSKPDKNKQGSNHRNKPLRLSMCHWDCPMGALADAGLLLRVAPALGVPAAEASRVRNALLEHLKERGTKPGAHGASARAALLFAYSDLVDKDRSPIFSSLKNYRLHPGYFDKQFRAVQFLAWGIFPVGEGWARTNQALRRFVANCSPQSPVDRAALLLTQLLYTAPSLESR